MASLTRQVRCAAVVLLAACATNPVTGRRELSLISESQEVQMGQQAAQQTLQSMPEIPDAGMKSLVNQMGLRIARASERPNLPWEFHTLDDPTVNAFALPGGFIFVTRGLVTHLNSEAELAQVIGHEIGHVTAKHSVSQISKAQIATIGLGVGSIFSITIASLGGVLETGLTLAFLKFGRDDEIQADDLGFRYSLNQRYDVREAVDVYEMLQALGSRATGRLPEWQSTHPDPGNRLAQTRQRITAVPAAQLTGLVVNEESYLRLLNGMVYGNNPRLGFFRGARFLHPDLRFEWTFPNGWQTANLSNAVVGQAPSKDAVLQLQISQNASVVDALRAFFAQQGIQQISGGTTTINGNQAALGEFDAQTESGVVRGMIAFIRFNNTTYGIIGYAPAQRYASYASTFRSSIGSFRELTDASALNAQPARIEVVTLPRDMTIETFIQTYPSSISAQDVMVLNDAPAGTQLRAGKLVKRVVGGVT
ncbi:MAG TPA: M48 family metalloprotease [Gemmatimonadaceae bacterium]|nr:M48 family metalloprotease [Gemmatimonadaceae bacterium]